VTNDTFDLRHLKASYWKRALIAWGVLLVIALVVLWMVWSAFFVYVPPGKHLVIIAKDGQPLPPDQVLAEPGEKGVRREVKGEGWHFVLPIVYTTELESNTTVPPGKVGIVTALGGKALPPGRILAEEGERGIQRQLLPPGVYRLNLHGSSVELADATEIKLGYVGVQQRLLGKDPEQKGKDGTGRFARGPDEKGILREVLQPGLYYINTKEFKIIPSEVGIFQTTLHKAATPDKDTAISFPAKGGLKITMDCTIEWEVLPEDMPALIAEYGSAQVVERNVIDQYAHAIGRDRGSEYGPQDLLEGSKRERFQEDFSQELKKKCKEKNVTVHSAYIRNIEIPETYMKEKRDKQIAAETELTNTVLVATNESEADVKREQQMIERKVKEVEYETTRLVKGIDVDVETLQTRTDAEIEKMRAEYQAQIAELQAQEKKVLGEADAEVKRLKETAQASLYQLKMDAFQNDGNAMLRYELSKQLNEKLRLRLFHSGPGTFWTNMDGKGTNLLLPAPGAPAPSGDKPPPAEKNN
jgi:regulator of protease activity HflC (stomatin/prohibitin superfamily)